MNGAHDMGGRQGFGRVLAEANEPVFHAAWEGRIFALAIAFGEHGLWSLDEDRHACENRPPHEYLARSYYDIWFEALKKLAVPKGAITVEELLSGKATARTAMPKLHAANVMAVVSAPGSYERDAKARAVFAPGDQVRVRNLHAAGHTRLPGYLRGCKGEVIAIRGCHVLPDSNAHGLGENPGWLYGVRFEAREVWGNDSSDKIHADMWESYLECA